MKILYRPEGLYSPRWATHLLLDWITSDPKQAGIWADPNFSTDKVQLEERSGIFWIHGNPRYVDSWRLHSRRHWILPEAYKDIRDAIFLRFFNALELNTLSFPVSCGGRAVQDLYSLQFHVKFDIYRKHEGVRLDFQSAPVGHRIRFDGMPTSDREEERFLRWVEDQAKTHLKPRLRHLKKPVHTSEFFERIDGRRPELYRRWETS